MIKIILAEGEAEALLRQFRHTGQNIECLLAIVRIDKPADRADVILEKIHKDRPGRRDRLGAHPPQNGLGRADRVASREQDAIFIGMAAQLLQELRQGADQSTLPPSSIAGMLAKFVSTVVKSLSLRPCLRNMVR